MTLRARQRYRRDYRFIRRYYFIRFPGLPSWEDYFETSSECRKCRWEVSTENHETVQQQVIAGPQRHIPDCLGRCHGRERTETLQVRDPPGSWLRLSTGNLPPAAVSFLQAQSHRHPAPPGITSPRVAPEVPMRIPSGHGHKTRWCEYIRQLRCWKKTAATARRSSQGFSPSVCQTGESPWRC